MFDEREWTIPADPDSAVKKIAFRIPGSAWVRIDKDREVAGTVHTLQETNKAFRLIVKRTRDRSTPLSNRLVRDRDLSVATNMRPTVSAVRVREGHPQRGTFEKFLKELKRDGRVGTMPTGESDANAAGFRIGVLLCNLLQGFVRDLLPAAWISFRLPTLRWKLFALPGKFVRPARALILKLAVPRRYADFLNEIRARCGLLRQPGQDRREGAVKQRGQDRKEQKIPVRGPGSPEDRKMIF